MKFMKQSLGNELKSVLRQVEVNARIIALDVLEIFEEGTENR